MANRLESTCWDPAQNAPIEALNGISHVTVTHKGEFLTDSMLEAHRINSPYLMAGKKKPFFHRLENEIGAGSMGPTKLREFAKILLKYDVGSLIHGVFLSHSAFAGGRLRLSRALSAFIEASKIEVARSGGVKNDHVHPGRVKGDNDNRFGNIPFARDEYVAESISCYINLDLAQIRGYGFEPRAEELLILLSLYRLRKLLDGDLRLRTACDLEPVDRVNLIASRPEGFKVPSFAGLEEAVKIAIANCSDLMCHTTCPFEDELKPAKDKSKDDDDDIDTAEDE